MKVKLYSSYYYRANEQDPVVDYLRAAMDHTRRSVVRADVVRSGLAASTMDNLFSGKTRSPRFSTVMVIARAIGPEAVESVSRCLQEGGRKKLSVVTNGGRRRSA